MTENIAARFIEVGSGAEAGGQIGEFGGGCRKVTAEAEPVVNLLLFTDDVITAYIKIIERLGLEFVSNVVVFNGAGGPIVREGERVEICLTNRVDITDLIIRVGKPGLNIDELDRGATRKLAVAGFNNAEKSPLRIACVGTVTKPGSSGWFWRRP